MIVSLSKVNNVSKLFMQEVTYQSVIATDGTETHVITLYEDGAMNWRPVYNIPEDIPRYPASVGYVLFVKSLKKEQHPYSGQYNGDESVHSVYHLDQVSLIS